jgi:hypothetical protein
MRPHAFGAVDTTAPIDSRKLVALAVAGLLAGGLLLGWLASGEAVGVGHTDIVVDRRRKRRIMR